MNWSTIRKATTDDVQRLAAAEERFFERYGVHPANTDELTTEQRAAYRRAVRRALYNAAAEGIAYGYVGFHAE